MPDPGFAEGPATGDDVVAAYRWIMGREPRSSAEVAALLSAHATRADLRRFLLATKGSLHEHLKSRLGPEKWVLTEVFGQKRMWLNLCDRHVSMGCLLGSWEPDETRFIREHLKPGQTFVDVGANIGWFTLVAADCVGEGGQVHSFEPQPRIFAYLARTLAENGLLGRVTPYPLALARTWETLGMRWSPASANAGHAWLEDHAWLDRAAAGEGALGAVRTGVLDDLLGGRPIDFIKIDAEGAEALVLAGARSILADRRPIVMVELMPAFLERVSGAKPGEVFEMFASLGYSGFAIGPGRLGAAVDSWPEGKVEMNVVFLPNER